MTHRSVWLSIVLSAASSAAFAQEWQAAAPFPGLGRHHPVTFALDGYGYLTTGSTTTGSTATDDFFRYDPVADSWEVLPDFPGPDRVYSYGGAYGGKGYLGFGFGGGVYLADLWEYDPSDGTWMQLATCPGVGRTHPAWVITDDGKIFVGMGGASTGNLRDWWEYDIATNVWTQKADLPGPTRHHPFYFNIGSVPYVCFGHGAGIYKDVYRFNPSNNTWTRLADLPAEGRVAGTQFTHAGKGYVLSGEDESHDQFDTGEFWEYDPSGDSWTQLTPHPGGARWAPGTFQIGNTVYLAGGLTNLQLERDMWKYEFLDPADVPGTHGGPSRALTVFPNPVRGDVLQILDLAAASAEPIEPLSVRLSGVDGREVANLAVAGRSVRVPTSVPPGRYFLTFADPSGRSHSSPITILR